MSNKQKQKIISKRQTSKQNNEKRIKSLIDW